MASRACKPYHLVSANTTNATSIKTAPAKLFGYEIANSNAAARYVKLYSKATAPTVGTDVPALTILVPPAQSVRVALHEPLSFFVGLALATTTGLADTDTGAVGTSDLSIGLFFE